VYIQVQLNEAIIGPLGSLNIEAIGCSLVSLVLNLRWQMAIWWWCSMRTWWHYACLTVK